MFDDNTKPVYLKNRNFAESAYGQQQQLQPSALQLADLTFNSKANIEKNTSKLEIQDELGMPVNYVRIKALEDDIRMNLISDKNSLHRAITPVLILAQICALLPVQGIRGKNTSYLVFNWFSWTVFYVFIVIAASLLILSFSLIKIYMTGLTYYSTGEIMFFGSSLVIYILFIHLAREWPKVMEKWELMEREMRQFGYPPKTAFKFKILTSIVMVLAIIEHSASVLTGIMKAIPCSTGGLDIFRAYFSMSFRQVFTLINYSLVIAIPLGLFNFMLACAWNYMDLFIIILACALSDKFKQLNQKLAGVKGKILPNTYWRKSRETYNLLASLTKDFDEFLSPVILLSFANNLYFICLQLLNSLKPMHDVWEAIYFVFSFTYLVGRTCAVSLYAASINDQSKKPKAILFSVPTESYGVEVARFLMQVTSDELALTGCNFFSVTRTLMLTVAGTIVTYEIVLIQFNSVNSEDRNFIEPGYERQLKQSSLSDSVAHSSYKTFSLKENKGNIALEIQDDLGMAVNYVRIKALEDSIRKDIISDTNSMHKAITPVLVLARVCALLPVQGIRGQNTSYLIFNWFSWPAIYSLIVIGISILVVSFLVLDLYIHGLTYKIMGDIIFYGASLVLYIVFIHLARKWPKVMEKWELMELEHFATCALTEKFKQLNRKLASVRGKVLPIGRTCAVSLYVASINDESKKPKAVLFSVPAECYGVEVQRFLTQVSADELSFTGCNFFSVTRTFMLTVAGTIVTYEIVLIQFNNVGGGAAEQNNTLINLCPKFNK
ncbi:hypothetical protein AGLY_007747 [Aphis glycines]|uniref:Gustatory receptor n=1 Tax=Aphis glycines TaxID=307491 RepID=A0A6G0TQ55_APHGL|nr:hypothetical protein AGLY_007747 [Aphis glycines]